MKCFIILLLFFLSSITYSQSPDSQKAIELYNRGAELIRSSNGAETLKAIQFFQESLNYDPEFKTAYQAITDAYILKYQITENPQQEWLNNALENIDILIKKFPGSGNAYLSKAILYIYLNKTDKAELEFKKALLSMPDNTEIYINYFAYLLEHKETADAVYFAEKTQNKKISDPDLYLFYAEQFLEKNELNHALDNAKYALSIKDDFLPALLILGDIYKKQGSYTKALKAYEKIAEFPDKPNDIYFKLGYIYAGFGEYQQAIDLTRKYLLIYPEDFNAIYNMAMYYEKTSSEEAKKIWKSIVNNPKAPESFKEKARKKIQ